MNYHDQYVAAQTAVCKGFKGPYGETATSIVYHRNGICGSGFYLITFKIKETGDKKRMLAVGWIHTDGDGFSEYFGVSTPEHLDRAWRGDHYAGWFQKLAERYQEAVTYSVGKK